jgi:hypothetical protein
LKDAAKLAKELPSAAGSMAAIGYFNGAQRGAASTEARGMLC